MTAKKIVSDKGHAAGRDVNAKVAPVNNVQTINGGTNIIGNQGHVQVVQTPRRPVIKRIFVPTDEHITPEQKVRLMILRDEWMALHKTLKKSPLTHSTAWSKINRAAGATSYHEIKKDRFDDALAFIKKEMAILRGMKSAPSKDAAWRTKRIAAIKTRCNKQFNGIDIYKPYIKKLGADSLSDLSMDDLDKTYRYVMAKKPNM